MNGVTSARTPGLVGAARALEPALAGLVAHVQGEAAGQPRQRVRQHGVEARRALAAADHEDADCAAPLCEARGRRRQRGDVGAHRIADHAGVDAAAEGAGKGAVDLARQARQAAVGEPGDGVLLVDHQRPARQPGGDAARAGDEAAEPDHHVGWCRRMTASASQSARARRNGAASQFQQALAAQAADAEPLDRDVLGRHQARLEPAARAEPDDAPRARAQHARQRQRREHVPAGAAGHDQDHRRAHESHLSLLQSPGPQGNRPRAAARAPPATS